MNSIKKIRRKIGRLLPFLVRLRKLYWYNKLFPSKVERIKFFSLISDESTGKLINLSVVQKNQTISFICRPHTTDQEVVMSVFARNFHYPPVKLQDSPIILDLGANIGLSILSLHYLYPNSKIIGLEMDKNNFDIASSNTNQLGDSCILINKAIWSKNGPIRYGGQDEQSFSIDNGNIVAEAINIQTIIAQFDLKRIDYIKMDIEGAENEIFKSDLEWLDMVNSINMEIHDFSKVYWFIDILRNHGFRTRLHRSHWSGVVGYK